MIACSTRLNVIVAIGITFRNVEGERWRARIGLVSKGRPTFSILTRYEPTGFSLVVESATCPFYDVIYPRKYGRSTKLYRKLCYTSRGPPKSTKRFHSKHNSPPVWLVFCRSGLLIKPRSRSHLTKKRINLDRKLRLDIIRRIIVASRPTRIAFLQGIIYSTGQKYWYNAVAIIKRPVSLKTAVVKC